MLDEKRGLWDNIHAKQERIKHGSGERMRRPGEKGRPTAADLKNSKSIKEDEIAPPEASRLVYTEARNNSLHRAKLIAKINKHARLKTPHETSDHFKTGETVEPQSKDPNDSDSRFDSTDSLVRIYKKSTPGQR
jgi:hypothetical protein